MADEKYRIERNTVQETLVIPLYGKKICSERYPNFFYDETSIALSEKIDYDWSHIKDNVITRFGIMEVGKRTLDLVWEIKDYLKDHPKAAVVNMGCGLDDLFGRVDNGIARGYNLDRADVIDIRSKLLMPSEREMNIAVDLNDFTWMDKIDFKPENGAVFAASGVFYYFKIEDMKKLLTAMAVHFPGGKLAFDIGNKRALKAMLKEWIRGSGMTLDAFFYLENLEILKKWLPNSNISFKPYLTGYGKLDKPLPWLYRSIAGPVDNLFGLRIVMIVF